MHEHDDRKLYVSHLTAQANDDDLRTAFGAYGQVRQRPAAPVVRRLGCLAVPAAPSFSAPAGQAWRPRLRRRRGAASAAFLICTLDSYCRNMPR